MSASGPRDMTHAGALRDAATQGHADTVRELLDARAAGEGALDRLTLWSPIQEACRGGHHEVARILAEAIVDPGPVISMADAVAAPRDLGLRVAASFSPLVGAAWRGWLDVVELLLARGLSPDERADLVVHEGDGLVRYRRIPALAIAAAFDQRDVVRRLLDAGADPSACGADGWTAIMYARIRGHAEVHAMLLATDRVACPRAPEMMSAAARGDVEALASALHQGLDPNAVAHSGEHTGNTALAVAAGEGNLELVERLLAWGATANPSPPSLVPPLTMAARGGHLAVIAALIEAGAELEARGHYGETAVLAAGEEFEWEAAVVLLEAGADANAHAHDGRTVLFAAVTHASVELLDQLLAYGANPRVIDREGSTLLDHAATLCERTPFDAHLRRIVAEAEAAGLEPLDTHAYRARLVELQREVDAVDVSAYESSAVAARMRARMSSPEFLVLVARIAADVGVEPQASTTAWVPGVSFVLPSSTRRSPLLQRYAEADALVLELGRDRVLSVLPTRDPIEAIAVAQVAGPNDDISDLDVLRWAMHVHRAHPFRLTAVGGALLEAEFLADLSDPALMGERVYSICPDAIDQGSMSMSALVAALFQRDLSLWWD